MKQSVYSRPCKPRRIFVKNRKKEAIAVPELVQPTAVSARTECHITPAAVALRMTMYLQPEGDILEPSAGTGQLVRALNDYKLLMGLDYNVTAIELNLELCEQSGAEQADFLTWQSPRLYDRVIMNPPFKQVRAHISKARSLLKPDGVLIALVPSTFKEGAVLETLSNETFALAKVNTKIIKIEGKAYDV